MSGVSQGEKERSGKKHPGCYSSMGDTPEDAMFGSEYAWSYEAGVKTNWLDNRV